MSLLKHFSGIFLVYIYKYLVHNNNVNTISRHLDYMVKQGIDVQEQHKPLPSFYLLSKLYKKPNDSTFIAASNKCTTKNSFHHCLLLVLKPYLLIINNTMTLMVGSIVFPLPLLHPRWVNIIFYKLFVIVLLLCVILHCICNCIVY